MSSSYHLIDGNGFFIDKVNDHCVTTIFISPKLPQAKRGEIANHLHKDLSSRGRLNILRGIEHGTDFNAAIAAHKVAAGINYNLAHKYRPRASRSHDALTSLSLFKESLAAGGEKYSEVAAEAAEKVAKLNELQSALVSAAKRPNFKYHFKQIAGKEYADAQDAVNRAVRLKMVKPDSEIVGMMSHSKFFRKGLKQGTYFDGMGSAKIFTKIANNGEHLNHGLFVLSLIMGGVVTFNAYKEGKDWEATAVNSAGDIGGGIVSGMAADAIITAGMVALELTPVGWIVLIGQSIAVGAASYYGGEKTGSYLEEGYRWAKSHLLKWL